MTNTNKIGRIEYLDGLRGIAAFGVAIMHFPLMNTINNSPFILNSFLFVDFFFVLSGYIIAKLYEGSTDRYRFIKHRIARIAPVFYLTLLFGVLLELFKILFSEFSTTKAFEGSNDLYALLREILMLHSLPFFENTSFNPPNWSISSEFFAYFFYASLMMLSFKLRKYIWFSIFILCILYAPFVNDLGNAHELAIYRCFFGFSSGFIISTLNFDKLSINNTQKFKGNFFVIFFTCLIFLYIYFGGFIYFPPALAFGLFLLLIMNMDCFLRGILFENKYVLFLGDISLTMYLVHFFIAMRYEEINTFFLQDSISYELLLISYIFFLILISYIITSRFERPMRNLLR